MALIFPCSLVILISPPSAVLFLLLAWEVIVPVVMSPWAVISIVPALPAPVLLADILLLGAVISPASILIMPPSPVPVVSVNIRPCSWNVSLELILISPPFPLSDVDADIFVFSAIVRFSVSILMMPAFPLPSVSTFMMPSPVIFMFSGALMNMLPPLPVEEVEADIKPLAFKVMSRSVFV